VQLASCGLTALRSHLLWVKWLRVRESMLEVLFFHPIKEIFFTMKQLI